MLALFFLSVISRCFISCRLAAIRTDCRSFIPVHRRSPQSWSFAAGRCSAHARTAGEARAVVKHKQCMNRDALTAAGAFEAVCKVETDFAFEQTGELMDEWTEGTDNGWTDGRTDAGTNGTYERMKG